MRLSYLLFSLLLLTNCLVLSAQCDYNIPPPNKRIGYAARSVLFENVKMNGQQTTFLAVNPGEMVDISLTLSAKKQSNYCPACIVQLYWGIHDYTSVCVASFGGYNLRKTKSRHRFKAPQEAGIYYITLGGSLDYQCKNHKRQPKCSPDYAFAVLKVGEPKGDPAVVIETVQKGPSTFLQTKVLRKGCFGDWTKVEWFLDGKKLDMDNKRKVPALAYGQYKVEWKNCKKDLVSATFDLKEPQVEVVEEEKPATIENQLEEKNEIVLNNLVFDLGKSTLKEASKDELNEVVNYLKKYKTVHISVEGHTDKIGKPALNLKLSEERSASVKSYLVKQGIAPERIATKGWGDTRLLIETDDKKKGKINRRVELKVIER